MANSETESPKSDKEEITPVAPVAYKGLVAVFSFLSGIAATLGIIFLVIFFSDIEANGRYGTLNDIMVIIHYTLLLPIAFTLYRILRPIDASRARHNLLVGLIGIVAVIILQLLLVLDVIPFALQIGPVIVAFVTGLGWFVLNRDLSRVDKDYPTPIPKDLALTIFAGLVFGYPIWSYQLGRNLLKMD